MQKITILTATLLLTQIDARFRFGSCPKVDTVENFDAEKYTGRWYEINRDRQTPFEKRGTCVTADYSLGDAESTIKVRNSMFRDGSQQTTEGTATCEGSRCLVSFGPYAPAGKYWVIDTDYENFSIVYSCTDYMMSMYKTEYLWVLARDNKFDSTEVLEKVKSTIEGYDVGFLMETVQEGFLLASCFTAQTYARFNWGSCPQVNTTQNFDAQRYMGRWYEIQRDIETSFQKDGTCVTATYTLQEDGSIQVFNEMTTKEGKRESAQGRATCDGSRCLVKFFWYTPTADYLVIDTDHENFSIVYSCADYMFGTFKMEFLWILSRHQNYDASKAREIIQREIPTYQIEWLQHYYQGEECQYTQTSNVTDTLLLSLTSDQVQARFSLGLCDNPNLVQNFDVAKYAGVWYEIYRDSETPFEKNSKCVTANYGLNRDNTLSVYNRGVESTDNSVMDVSGFASCINNEANCEVQFNFFARGDYRVISTDYDKYSLVFSCSSYYLFKNEFFWILSKQRTIDDSLLQEIKGIMEIEVPRYQFESLLKTDQGDSCDYGNKTLQGNNEVTQETVTNIA
eukprot:403342759